MVDHRQTYAQDADNYDRLVSAEDCDGNLLPALSAIVPLEGARVLEVGVGTGRLTRGLLSAGARVVGCEPAAAMLSVARRKLAGFPADRLSLYPVSAQEIPIEGRVFDLALAGWVFGHFRTWFEPRWREEIGACLDRMESGLVPGGVLVIIETLGTGQTEPTPPNDALAEYYAWLENERGMSRQSLRTDYRFADVDAAARVTGTFFGEVFAARVRRERWARVPECTGVWSVRR